MIGHLDYGCDRAVAGGRCGQVGLCLDCWRNRDDGSELARLHDEIDALRDKLTTRDRAIELLRESLAAERARSHSALNFIEYERRFEKTD